MPFLLAYRIIHFVSIKFKVHLDCTLSYSCLIESQIVLFSSCSTFCSTFATFHAHCRSSISSFCEILLCSSKFVSSCRAVRSRWRLWSGSAVLSFTITTNKRQCTFTSCPPCCTIACDGRHCGIRIINLWTI
jgi:hypothetical protein